MLKKLLSTAVAAAMLGSMAVLPAHAATFSSANWAQYERGLYTSTSQFSEYFKTYADTSFDDDQLTGVKMVSNTKNDITGNKNPVAYKYGENAADYGDHASDNASYAHMRFYIASFSDTIRTATNYLQLRIDKDGTGSSREHYYFDTWVPSGRSDYCTSLYPCSYSSSNAYTTKDWFDIVHQGRAGNGPDQAETANSHQTQLTDSDYDKIDLIMKYNNKNSGATSYIFANGKFMGSYFDSGLTDKHFHGVVIRITADSNNHRTLRNNSDYVAMKFDSDRIGHREYYNTEDYTVTLEDVMQDAGLGADSIDSTMIYKSRPIDLQWYMPGNESKAYTYEDGYSARQRINTNVTYSGTAATIAASNTSSDWAAAAKMLSGLYPVRSDIGASYESYHPRAKYIKMSFDQTISNQNMQIKYQTRYGSGVDALKMRDDGGKLVVSIVQGSSESAETCNGSGKKPEASTTGTNHIDWVLEPVDGSTVKQYVFVNNKYVGEGYFGNQNAVRINDIILSTKNAAGNVTINNWDMTVYNETANLPAIAASITHENIIWGSDDYEMGYEKKDNKIAVLVTATNKEGVVLSENTKVFTAIYDKDGRLVDAASNTFVSDQTLSDETVTNTFDYSPDMKTIKAFVWDFVDENIHKQTNAFTMSIE